MCCSYIKIKLHVITLIIDQTFIENVLKKNNFVVSENERIFKKQQKDIF